MLRVSGIYRIINKTNNKIYIGSAVDTEKRKRQHWRALLDNKHKNAHLQAAWDKYGSNVFEFDVIELCYPEDLIKREQCLINELNPQYNINKIAQSSLGIKRRPESIEKGKLSTAVSEAVKRQRENHKETMRLKWLEPGYRERVITNQNAGRSTKEYREKRSDISRRSCHIGLLNKRIVITTRGLQFESVTAAAAYFGVHISTLTKYLKNGKEFNGMYIKYKEVQ